MTAVVLIVIAVLLIAGAHRLKLLPVRVTIFEYQRGLRYNRGRFSGVLQPGQYLIAPMFTTIVAVDARQGVASISGQETPSKDGTPLKFNLAARFRVVDPALAVNSVQSYQAEMHVALQLALRETASEYDAEELMTARKSFGEALLAKSKDQCLKMGVELLGVDIKDLILPPELKRMHVKAAAARKEGQALLEKARGETAALRHLANAASLLEDKPALLKLRAIQALGDQSDARLVLNLEGDSLKRDD